MADEITSKMMEEGVNQLNQLAESEYGLNLSSVVKYPDRFYFGRLLGIMIKEPFSEVQPYPEFPGTKRRWEIVTERLDEPSARETWQFRLIEQLQKESVEYGEENYPSIDAMVERVKSESGLFWHLVRSIRKYICNDPKFARELSQKMDGLRQAGVAATLPSASIAASLATTVAVQIPWLGIASAPVITGVVILLWNIGSDAFCSWSAEIIKSRRWYRDS
jgi:hypothetical protein